MTKTSTVHCYISELISNDDGRFDKFGSSWFTVSSEWLIEKINLAGYESLEDFYSTYTYDNSEGLLQLAVDEGVLLGCGTGLVADSQNTLIRLRH